MNCHKSSCRQRGFTMIELMLVVAILAIIAAFAVPAFNKSAIRAKRSDALVALEQAAAAQERFFAINSRYSDNADPFAGTDEVTSPQGLYTVTVAVNGAQSTYTATAEPVDSGAQSQDADCTAFTLTNTGQKGSSGAFASAGRPMDCWK